MSHHVRWGACIALALSACASPAPTVAPDADRHVLQYGASDEGDDGGYAEGYGVARSPDRFGAFQLQPTEAWSDSNYARTFARRAIDDNTDRQWASGGYNEPEAWLALRFDRLSHFDYADIKTGPLPRGAGYRFEVSSDGRDWRAVTPLIRNTSWNLESKRIDANGRFLRVHFYNAARRTVPRFSIFEIKVFGRGRGFRR